MTVFTIEIISDPVCPWCYIGKKRLDRAIALYQKVYPNGRHDTFTIRWKAYYLDPTAPTHGISFAERQLQKIAWMRQSQRTINTPITENKGVEDKEQQQHEEDLKTAQKLRAHLTTMGHQEGINFSFAGLIGRTRSAHRAIALSTRLLPTSTSTTTDNAAEKERAQAEVQDRFVMALFAAYFEGDLDITSHSALADVAGSLGLSAEKMFAWLESEEDEAGAEVDAEDRAAKENGGAGVPRFAVQGVPLDGARDVQDLLELFVEIKREEEETGGEAKGELRMGEGAGMGETASLA